MKSKARGKNISKVDVVSVSRYGVWLNAGGKEYVLPYAEFPWFKYAKPSQLKHIQFLHGHHLFWPKLDIDLATSASGIGDRESGTVLSFLVVV